jgi:glycosyltransferase involved in cell wall biosynthesis
MQIAISGMFWARPTVGSGQYLRGLLAALARAAPQHRYSLLLPASDLPELPALPPGVACVPVPAPFDRSSKNGAKLWFEQVGAPLAALRLGADVLHVPYFAPPLVSPVPVVVSILDIIPLLLPEYRGRAAVRAYMRLVASAARRARQILAISEATRADLVGHLGLAPERILVSPLAPGPQYRPFDPGQARTEVAARLGLCEPYIYYVGGLDARKNVATLVRAFARLRRHGGPRVALVIAGRPLGHDPLLFPDLERVIAEEGVAAEVRRVDAPPELNPALYAAAEVFAFPSRYEGFGLGPLEAMACDTPVITSNASSLPEVAGDAAICVAPGDVSAWAEALWRVLADERLRAELRRRGLRRAAQFTYDDTAQITLRAYERAASSSLPPARAAGSMSRPGSH